MLRHRATASGLNTDHGGWASYKDILEILWVQAAGVDAVTLDDLAENRIGSPSLAGRYEARHRGCESFFRASQGHTMPHISLEAVGTRVPPHQSSQAQVLYHSCTWDLWQSGLLEKGLVPGGAGTSRHKVVFFSTDPEHWCKRRRAHLANSVGGVVVIAVDPVRIH